MTNQPTYHMKNENERILIMYYFYSAPECHAFTIEGSAHRNRTSSLTGTTATIECTTTYSLVGSAKLTCQEDLSWSSDIPKCDKIGKLNS